MTGDSSSKVVSEMTDKLDKLRAAQKWKIEEEARPGETYAQAVHRLQVETDKNTTLLAGGDKSTEDTDIKTAQGLSGQ